MDFITNENSLPKQVVINKDNIEILQANMEIVDADSVEALSYATAAIAKADTAYDLASSVEGTASEAKSIADSANTTANTANTNANKAISLANTNKEAIEALGDLDAEAIANLQTDVTTLKETTSAQEIEISTVVAQVDAVEDDITDMKVTITSNTTLAARANNVAEGALEKGNDNASSIVAINDELLDVTKSIGVVEGKVDYLPYVKYDYPDINNFSELHDMLKTYIILNDYEYIDITLINNTGYGKMYIRVYPQTLNVGQSVILNNAISSFSFRDNIYACEGILERYSSNDILELMVYRVAGANIIQSVLELGWAATAKAYRTREVTA